MRSSFTGLLVAMSLAVAGPDALGQSSFNFDVAAYEAFLASHNDIPSSQLLSMYPAGTFLRSSPTLTQQPRWLESIDRVYSLTTGEKILLGMNGFVVTERIAPGSLGKALFDIWKADLPVFISSDAILHALHMSYDEILKQTEEWYLTPQMRDILNRMHGTLPTLGQKYQANPAMMPSLMDLDLFLTVARSLLNGTCTSYYPSNIQPVATVLGYIKAEYPALCAPLFADSLRLSDYSQFTVRGHYTQSEELSRYFQAMIWLGRTEFYLSPPVGANVPEYSEAMIQRQAVAALLFAEASALAGTDAQFHEINDILGFFVGEQDNVTLLHMNGLLSEAGVTAASDLLDTLKYRSYRETLLTKSWAYQRILSQILAGDFSKPGGVQPASAFIPLGQRFIIDSFVSGKVVFDKIYYEGKNVWRELPSTLDVLFALGNDAAGQLVVPELDRYHYADNLAALRYLIDSYEPDYWKETLFNGWLNAIRALNPPRNRSGLPPFMQTAAWWQEKMNTQLASWAELRHDNLLYAKQSYTASGACSFPAGYVEPIPSFYGRIDTLMRAATSFFEQGPSQLQYFITYFKTAARTCSTLASIAQKELDRTPLSAEDNTFLSETMHTGVRCGPLTGGWYPSLFINAEAELQKDMVVADVHTCPTDIAGNLIGWVLHVGTGPVDMAVVVADVPELGPSAFIGPVMSYYQRVTTQFDRLTDEEWATEYATKPSQRPPWVNVYLADIAGQPRPLGDMLLTDVALPSGGGVLPSDILLAENYPNPFNPSTQIHFGLPQQAYVSLNIYDILGRKVAELVNGPCQAGYHTVTWDGKSSSAGSVASGIYLARFVVTSGPDNVVYSKTNRMMLLK